MHCDGWVSGQGIGPKNHTIKSNNIHKDFELIKSSCIIFSIPKCHDIPIIHITYKKS